VFTLPPKFTKYALYVYDELMLFYVRTHYISFVRLYNKNYNEKLTASHESKSADPKAYAKNRSMTLCKEHLECLFAISR